MSEQAPVVVVGGGFSGIAVADALLQAGRQVLLVDRGDSLGGRSTTGYLGRWAVTFGGKNIGRRYRLFRSFATRFGVEDWEPFGINTTQVDGGVARTLDAEHRALGYLRFARGMTPRDVSRFGRLYLSVRRDEANRFLGAPGLTDNAHRLGNPTLAEYFGRGFCRRVVRPMTVRMNGAEPDEVRLANFGANLGMLFDTYDQPREGLQPLFDRFATHVPIRQGAIVENLLWDRGAVRGVKATLNDGSHEEIEASSVVLAIPAEAAGPLVAPISPALASALARVAYYPAAVALARYERSVFSPERRAFVFGSEHALSNAGAYAASQRQIVRYTFSGRRARTLLEERPTDRMLLSIGERLLAPHASAPPRGATEFAVVRWRAAYCAYASNHSHMLRAIATRPRGLYLTGDYLAGASIEACFRAAESCAQQLLGEPDHGETNPTVTYA
jgi:protoporphyrinogen/coproporphyrinogen III oxidase